MDNKNVNFIKGVNMQRYSSKLGLCVAFLGLASMTINLKYDDPFLLNFIQIITGLLFYSVMD